MSYRAKHSALTQEWREAHCLAGDEALDAAESLAEDSPSFAAGYAAIAQAHYAAANVRAKPAPQSGSMLWE